MIAPGGSLGVFGSGQLGRMFAHAAQRMGFRVHVYSPESSSPAGRVADREFVGEYNDEDRVAEFCRSVDVVTFEFENVPAAISELAERFVPVRPGGSVLHVCQHRLREKGTLRDAGLPVPPYAEVRSADDLQRAVDKVGLPGVLKTASSGYDGKGQVALRDGDSLDVAWNQLQTDEAIYEAFIDFEKELSAIGIRGLQGEIAIMGPFENNHENHILDVSQCPARIAPQVHEQAVQITRSVVEELDVVGVICVEMFLTRTGTLLINELAPRPHNSGHLTIEAFATSQFEQHVRAITGLPLGSTELWQPAAMANLLGDVWTSGEPNWAAATGVPGVSLHLYGKDDPKPGRKMGHLTALGDDLDIAIERVLTARKILKTPRT